MELDVKNLASILLFLLPGYYFLQGRHRFIPARDLTTLQETAQFFISSIFINILLVGLLSRAIDVGVYLDSIRVLSVGDIIRDHLWIISLYVVVSLIAAHYCGRIYGWLALLISDRGLIGWGHLIIRPTLRNENFFLAVMRQRHIPHGQRKRYVFIRALMKDGSRYEGFVRKYTFQEKQDFALYVRTAIYEQGGIRNQLYWEEPPFDGVIIKSDAVSSLEISYRNS